MACPEYEGEELFHGTVIEAGEFFNPTYGRNLGYITAEVDPEDVPLLLCPEWTRRNLGLSWLPGREGDLLLKRLGLSRPEELIGRRVRLPSWEVI